MVQSAQKHVWGAHFHDVRANFGMLAACGQFGVWLDSQRPGEEPNIPPCLCTFCAGPLGDGQSWSFWEPLLAQLDRISYFLSVKHHHKQTVMIRNHKLQFEHSWMCCCEEICAIRVIPTTSYGT